MFETSSEVHNSFVHVIYSGSNKLYLENIFFFQKKVVIMTLVFYKNIIKRKLFIQYVIYSGKKT